MRNISLKWLIFSFYLVFGYIPAIGVSYFSIDAFSRSVASSTESRYSDTVRRIAESIGTSCLLARKDLEILAVRLAATGAASGPSEGEIRGLVSNFSRNKGFFQGIGVFSREGALLAECNGMRRESAAALLTRDGPVDRLHFEAASGDAVPGYVRFVRRVDDARKGEAVPGFIVADVPLDRLTVPLLQTHVEDGVGRGIVTREGASVFAESVPQPTRSTILQKTRLYTAEVPGLDWLVAFQVPESVLFRDVNRVVYQNLASIGLVALLAVVFAFEFSRRATKPLNRIIDGTREFASGNLDHRIQVLYGRETRELAHAFNAMARHLSENHEQLVQANKLSSLGLLAAGIAHEIKNPLAGIKTSAQVLVRLLEPDGAGGGPGKAANAGEAGDFAAIRKLGLGVVKEVDRLHRIVDEMLNLSRPRPSEIVRVDVAEIVAHSLDVLQNEFKRKGVVAESEVAHETVEVDPDQMIQVFINLLLNAIAAVDAETGRIRLSSEISPDGDFLLRLTDNGRGIPNDKVGQIFDPFFSLTREGTGLGLSVAHALLRQNRVRVGVSSREGQGTLITLTFRRLPDEQVEEPIRG